MSNRRKLTQLNPGSGQASRPKHTWRGYRWPRSVHKRHEIELAIARARKASRRLKLPDPKPCQEATCQAAESAGVLLTPWQHDLMHQLDKEENVA